MNQLKNTKIENEELKLKSSKSLITLLNSLLKSLKKCLKGVIVKTKMSDLECLKDLRGIVWL
jgi:hypothetical protein